jgi:hypothetical protein
MRESVKNKWVAALKSGKYKQGHGALHSIQDDNETFCCLGVLCEVFMDEGNGLDVGRTQNNFVKYNGQTSYPPKEVREWAGMCHVSGRASNANYCVAAINDTADSFTPSIEYIEQYWKNM